MNKIEVLNQHLKINSEEIERVISELMEREEYAACTGNGCRVDFCPQV